MNDILLVTKKFLKTYRYLKIITAFFLPVVLLLLFLVILLQDIEIKTISKSLKTQPLPPFASSYAIAPYPTLQNFPASSRQQLSTLLSAKTAAVLDSNSGVVLFTKNP